MMEEGLLSKVEIMRRYPDLSNFTIKAYYEKEPALLPYIIKLIEQYTSFKSNQGIKQIDTSNIRPGIDIGMMYREMYYASEGFLWEKNQKGDIDVDEMEREYKELIGFWKKLYTKED